MGWVTESLRFLLKTEQEAEQEAEQETEQEAEQETEQEAEQETETEEVDFLDELESAGIYDTVLVDGDIIVYRAAATMNEDTSASTRATIKKIILAALDRVERDAPGKQVVCLTPKGNFRLFVDEKYKESRKDLERPKNLKWAQQWTFRRCGRETMAIPGLEADDIMAKEMTEARKRGERAIVATIDKDLLQVEGSHLHLLTGRIHDVDGLGELTLDEKGKVRFTGMLGFYHQCLVGDSTDSILGCAKKVEATRMGAKTMKRQGVGPKASYKMLKDCKSTEEAEAIVMEQYEKIYGDQATDKLRQQGRLLWMARDYKEYRGDTWVELWAPRSDERREWMNIHTGKTKAEARSRERSPRK